MVATIQSYGVKRCFILLSSVQDKGVKMTDLRKMFENHPSQALEKFSYYPGQGGKKLLTCKKCVIILHPYPLEHFSTIQDKGKRLLTCKNM